MRKMGFQCTLPMAFEPLATVTEDSFHYGQRSYDNNGGRRQNKISEKWTMIKLACHELLGEYHFIS